MQLIFSRSRRTLSKSWTDRS